MLGESEQQVKMGNCVLLRNERMGRRYNKWKKGKGLEVLMSEGVELQPSWPLPRLQHLSAVHVWMNEQTETKADNLHVHVCYSSPVDLV